MSGDYHAIPGSPEVRMFHLHYVGGALDGTIENSFRPYDAMRLADGIYAADEQGERCLEWVDDFTRKIILKYRGRVIE